MSAPPWAAPAGRLSDPHGAACGVELAPPPRSPSGDHPSGELAKARRSVRALASAKLLSLPSQVSLVDDGGGARKLLRALAFVRAHEKFDPRVASAFPHLISYFAKVKKSEKAQRLELPKEIPA